MSKRALFLNGYAILGNKPARNPGYEGERVVLGVARAHDGSLSCVVAYWRDGATSWAKAYYFKSDIVAAAEDFKSRTAV